MISIKWPRFKNSETLAAFSTRAPELTPLVPILRIAYSKYYKYAGNPFFLMPISSLQPIHKELLLGLYDKSYKKQIMDYQKLNWIFDLRKNESLPYCPMCGNTGRDALDHYLAKSDYPEFSFLTFNLVPTCTSCNSKRGKNANKPGASAALLHPYFDGLKLNSPLTTIIINGTIKGNGENTFEMPFFELKPYISANDPLFPRLDNHLKTCVNNDSLRRWVAGRWKNWRLKANTFTSLEGLRAAVKIELEAETMVGGCNNWTSAFLRGLLDNSTALEWIRQNPYNME